jgi:2-oxoisovalerate dehydrogenase E1 component alpha subunit
LIRVGHHSTSDDSFAYRPRSEVENWKKTDNPIWRMRRFLEGQKWWDDAAEQELKDRYKKEVMAEFRRAEALKRHPLGELFTDVYGGEVPWNLVSSGVLGVAVANDFYRGNRGRSSLGY